MAANQPFECAKFTAHIRFMAQCISILRIKVKEMRLSYHAEEVFAVDIPALQHGNDGLIYTCVGTPYTPGTDKNMCVSIVLLP